MVSMETTLPSFVILALGQAVILDPSRREVDVFPQRLTLPLLALVAASTRSSEGDNGLGEEQV